MPRFDGVRDRFRIECCETCKEKGTATEVPRLVFDESGVVTGEHRVPSDANFAVTAASENARDMVGKVFQPRQEIRLNGAGWLEGYALRDVC